MRTKDNGVSVKSIAGAAESSVAIERSGVDRRGPRWLGLIRDDLFTEVLCLPSTSGLETLNCDHGGAERVDGKPAPERFWRKIGHLFRD